MSAADVATVVRRWLQSARADLEVAEYVVAAGRLEPRIGCYHAQPAAEKALKSILVFLQIRFPFRHDLNELRNLIPADWNVVQDHPDLGSLSQWVARARYPGNWSDPSEADCREAARQAREVWETVLADLNQHGFDTSRYR